ncbi:MAG TPA: glycoside hydrolase family 15 protein [Polyangiaceae bacterium]|nr:glycoside hydrolase family 15 protein [Polyangiaceae bacterium]
MSVPIEDYALIGDCQCAALVSKTGSIDWLCLPRFDSDACFAALLGGAEQGHWSLRPVASPQTSTRRYLPDTLILETYQQTSEGAVRVFDFMPLRDRRPDLVRIVVGEQGEVQMRLELVLRFGFGRVVPWVHRADGALQAVAGPDLVQLVTPVALRGENLRTIAEFTVRRGDRVPFVLSWFPSESGPQGPRLDAERALLDTRDFWADWASRSTVGGAYAESVRRSLITLKALTFAPTGGVVAAPTTSLPEDLKGARNWDYRFCWIRDSTFTLYALLSSGYRAEADAWRRWLLRAVAGSPEQLQTLYGIAGERRLTELELPWLPGYEGSKPVRIGNAATTQLQLDVWGELMDALHLARKDALGQHVEDWPMQRSLVERLEEIWQEPDEGIWEIRGPRRHFTHSKVMAWVAFDRAVKGIEEHGFDGPVARWRKCRDDIHRLVCERGYDARRGTFTQSFGDKEVDASLLMLPLLGFLPAADARIAGTVRAIEQDLLHQGLVRRYRPRRSLDGLAGAEGVFLPCSFWLVDNYVLQGQHEKARRLLDRLLSLRNDLGLLAEEYDPVQRRLLGNYPQAFSHVSLVNSVLNLESARGPAQHRSRQEPQEAVSK